MKTVAKKTVKKMPVKLPAKPAVKAKVKAASKKLDVPVKAKPKSKTSKSEATKLVTPVKKAIAKPVTKAVSKLAVKTATKTVEKSIVKTAKVAASTVTKAGLNKNPVKAIEAKSKKAVKTTEKSKISPSPIEKELNLKQTMVIASKIVPSETKDSPVPAPTQSKAKTSRLAQLTVPSMAQAVASTAAKASYGLHVPMAPIISPPQFTPKQNPKLANNWKTKSVEEMNDEELLAMPDAEYMNIKQMMYFRMKLLQLKQGLLVSAGATTEHLRDESAVVPDPTDRATIEEEHALELRTRDRERKLLKKIEQSIARIDAGDYGYCDETGEAIGVGRLLARPTATLSLEAQQRRELKQKMFGD